MARKKENLTPEERLQSALVPASEQPYKLPENWCWVRLELLLQNSKEKTNEFSDATLKYVSLEHMQKNSGIVAYDSAEGIKSLKNVFHPQQILYGKLRPYLNKHDIATFDGVCSTDILVFSVTPYTIPEFINFFLDQDTFIEYAVSNSKGINLPRVSEDTVLNAKCPLPPLAEQQRIVDRIESLFAKLDEAGQKAQAALDSFEIRKAAILHQAFTGKLTAKWRKEHGVRMAIWQNYLFEDCVLNMQNGLSKRSGNSGNLFGVIKLINLSNDEITTNDLREIHLTDQEQSKYLLKDNDILMIRVNGSKNNVGKQFLFSNKLNCAFCDHIIRVVYKKEIFPAYMVYFSKTNIYRRYIEANLVSSAGQNTISRKGMAHLSVPVPSLIEQIEIVRILDSLLAKEQQARKAAEGVLEQIELIKKAILAQAFRGKLGTNNPQEESAVELLKLVIADQ